MQQEQGGRKSVTLGRASSCHFARMAANMIIYYTDQTQPPQDGADDCQRTGKNFSIIQRQQVWMSTPAGFIIYLRALVRHLNFGVFVRLFSQFARYQQVTAVDRGDYGLDLDL